MDPQERESDIGDESPVHDEDITDGEMESGRDQDDDSGDDMRRHTANSMMADHGDVLAKLKMQVRDIKMDEYQNGGGHLAFPGLPGRNMTQEGFHIPAPFPFPHPNTPFMAPMMPQPAAPSSGSSHSSEGSASSQHTWSFEEQFKQVRQLYEINDDPKRKEFLDDLFSFMQKRGTPINRLPIMAKSVLDLYELYNLVIARGGLVDVINKKLWQEIIKGLHLPSSITSAAFTLRTQYMKYLYPYECDKRRLSTPQELQAAIDGNRREGRRSSYGQYDTMQRSPNTSQISPLAIVSQQQQLAARVNSMMSGGIGLHNGAHHPSHPQPLGHQPLNGGPIHGLAPHEIEARMLEYVKLLNKELRHNLGSPSAEELSSPSGSSPLDALNMQRMNLWNLYNNNPPSVEPQKEALNLADAVQNSVKRENDTREESASPPPPKKFSKSPSENNCEDKVISPMTTHIKIDSRRDSRNGETSNSLVVSMELNGVTYQGVLFAQTSQASSNRSTIAS